MAGFRSKYKKQKQDLLKRHQDSVANKEGKTFSGIIDNGKLPKGIGFWDCPSADHVIDYIPFEAGNNMPLLFEGDPDKAIQEGEYCWGVDLHVHTRVGTRESTYICPSNTDGEPCPICEYIKESKGGLPKEEYSAVKPKRYTLHFIWCHDNSDEEKKGIQIWQVPHFFMEKHMKKISEKPKGGGTILYFDPDTGKSVAFTKSGGKSNWIFDGHRFIDRDEPIPDKILDQSFPLDSILKRSSYEEIYKAFYGVALEEAATETEEFPVEDEEYGEEELPFDADEQEGEQEEELAPDICPADGEFGVDIDTLEDCKDCPNWDNCYATSQEMQEPEPEPESEPEPEQKRRPALKNNRLRNTAKQNTDSSRPKPIRKPARPRR